MEIPQRYSLAVQAADSIRKAVRDGVWSETLPGERTLCRLLQVSRPTMKSALDILRHEGVVDVQCRRRTRILPAKKPGKEGDRMTVVLLTGKKLPFHAVNVLTFIGGVQQALSAGGFRLQIVDDLQLGRRRPHGFLEKLTSDKQILCYLLVSVSEEVQAFFAKARLPALVCGSPFPGITLPSCDWNYEAIGRHAAGVFLAAGHRHLCVVRPSTMKRGDWDGEEGFRSVATRGGAQVKVIANAGRSTTLHAAIRKVFREERRPTAIIATDPYDCVTTLFALESLQIKVPEDVSLISLDWARIFEALPLRVASYIDDSRFVEKLKKLVLKLASNRVLPSRETLVMADFTKGDTVGPVKTDGRVPMKQSANKK